MNNDMAEFWILVDLILIIGQSIFLALFSKPLVDRARDKYFKKIERDLKQNAISEEMVNKVRGLSSGLQGRYWMSVLWGVISFIVVYFVGCVFLELQPEAAAILANFVLLGITQIKGISLWCTIDNIVEGVYEATRCPHCHAPISYFLINSYNTDEYYFKKREKRVEFKGSNSYSYYVDVPMVGYTVNEVFRCDRCNAEDTIRHKEQIESKYYYG